MYALGYVQAGATTSNNVGSCKPTMLRPFPRGEKFDWFQTLHNDMQQHPTTCNRVCKRTQHVTCNNVGSCWPTMLCPFALNIRHLTSNVPLQKQAHRKTLPLKSGVPIRLCECKWGFKGYHCFQPLIWTL